MIMIRIMMMKMMMRMRINILIMTMTAKQSSVPPKGIILELQATSKLIRGNFLFYYESEK